MNIENWRPITLLNNDAKIFASIFAQRLKVGLGEIIDEEQSGFMAGRSIINNVRLILDLIDYNEYINEDSLVLFVDFYKAFDTVNHQFIVKTLNTFGFGERFVNTIGTLYKGCNSSVKLHHGTSPRFTIDRGIKQGCPLSLYLFLLVAQMLATHIKQTNFHGICAFDREFKISQLADDTAIFIKTQTEVSKVVNCIREFSDVSGLTMNVEKSVLLPLKTCGLPEVCGIPIQNTVTYLGVTINNQSNRSDLNFSSIINQVKKRFNMWLMRDLSIYGRVLLAKTEGISRSVYMSLSMDLPVNICKELDKMLFNFIWRNKAHCLKKEVLCNQRGNGGLEVLSFETMNNMFKINWLCRLVREKVNIWNAIPNDLFNKLGGIHFFLKCNFKIDKIPIKLSNFHKQALLSWGLIYKRGFSPTSCYIWNNQHIQHRNKTIFYKSWFDQGILWVNQLIDKHGQILSYNQFINKYHLTISQTEYTTVSNTVPVEIQQLLKGSQFHPLIQKNDTKIFIHNIDITTKFCSNKVIRNLIQPSNRPAANSYWNSLYGEINWRGVWLVGEKLFIHNKVKEISYKICHNVYPAKKTWKDLN